MPIDPHAVLRQTLLATAAIKSLNELSESLVSTALQRGEGVLSASGALAVNTGKFTGRSPKDKFIVRDGLTEGSVWWTNSAPLAPEHFDMLLADAVDSLSGKALFVQDLVAGADPAHAMGVSIYTETAWHALFIRNLLIRPEPGTFPGTSVTIVHAPYFSADPDRHGTRTPTAIALDMRRKIVVIAGTLYAGEIKKSVFSLFNFHAPKQDVLPMHCSANLGQAGDVALFFGLSGTGKTTLSTDPKRPLIGDDEHGWTPQGVFNLEGGCYAKTAKLNQKAEPEIFAAVQRPGTVLENVVLGENGMPDFDDLSRTENTRAAYPIEALPAIARGGVGGAPRTVVFLTADAFGVLPPIARLSPEQAVYHFLSGYTAKVAGTERGVTEPEATFSACFGAPFMPLHPQVYGAMLKTRLKESGAATYLLNTGWTGGPYGVGRRIDIATTRRLLDAALSGMLEEVEMRIDSAFGFAVPVSVPGIDAALLDPRRSWADKAAYDRAAENLVGMFIRNFGKFGEDARAEAAAGPSLVAAE